jgi:hypothetical protein
MSKVAAINAAEYAEVVKTNEIANRQMKHVEVKGKEILIAINTITNQLYDANTNNIFNSLSDITIKYYST